MHSTNTLSASICVIRKSLYIPMQIYHNINQSLSNRQGLKLCFPAEVTAPQVQLTQVQPGVSVHPCSTPDCTLQNLSWPQTKASQSLSLVRKRISGGLELPGLGGEQVGLWEDLVQPDGRAPGLQPSGVNLSNCQAKYCKSLAITETVKGQMQFPELFTQSEAPPPSLSAKNRQN